jgi:hypothetical protein
MWRWVSNGLDAREDANTAGGEPLGTNRLGFDQEVLHERPEPLLFALLEQALLAAAAAAGDLVSRRRPERGLGRIVKGVGGVEGRVLDVVEDRRGERVERHEIGDPAGLGVLSRSEAQDGWKKIVSDGESRCEAR